MRKLNVTHTFSYMLFSHKRRPGALTMNEARYNGVITKVNVSFAHAIANKQEGARLSLRAVSLPDLTTRIRKRFGYALLVIHSNGAINCSQQSGYI